MICMNKVKAKTKTKIKALLMILLISSCSGFDFIQAAPVLKNYLVGYKDIAISDDFINQQEYSFVKIKIGKSQPVILSLAYVRDGVYEWVSADGARIFTSNGRIFKTQGLVSNSQLMNKKNFPSINLLPVKQSRLIELTNPHTITEQISNTYIEYERDSFISLKEEVKTIAFRWNYINTYLINIDDGLVIQSVQKIHPNLDEFHLEFYYKF